MNTCLLHSVFLVPLFIISMPKRENLIGPVWGLHWPWKVASWLTALPECLQRKAIPQQAVRQCAGIQRRWRWWWQPNTNKFLPNSTNSMSHQDVTLLCQSCHGSRQSRQGIIRDPGSTLLLPPYLRCTTILLSVSEWAYRPPEFDLLNWGCYISFESPRFQSSLVFINVPPGSLCSPFVSLPPRRSLSYTLPQIHS